jgi:hypothetical protein
MDYQPAWITEELHQLLAALDGHNQRKKRTTVLRLAEARATGGTDAAVFRMPECCSRTCWEGKYKAGVKQVGWRDDPAIAAALVAACQRAQYWQDQAEARRIAKRQEQVAAARDKLADLAYPAVMVLGALMADKETQAETRRKAANDVLDRADEATASKAILTEKGDHVQRVQFDFSGLPPEILRALADGGDEAGAGGGGQGGTE